MMPNMNPRAMAQMMKRMGINQAEIDATQVLIKTPTKTIIIDNPTVTRVNAMGQESFQISGQISEQTTQVQLEITADDVKTVMDATKVSEEKARQALVNTNGDLASAIMSLQ
jgi:nascent polypeptide-associated complex subunit alpha